MRERIKELRHTLGLTQQEFADRLGIKRGALANYGQRDDKTLKDFTRF